MATSSNMLFVYGSLRSGFRNPVYQYITQYFDLIGEAVVRGRLYDNGRYPVAAADSGEHYITGELYQLKDSAQFNWAFEQLDDYEGLNVEGNEVPLYKRELAAIYHEKKEYTAWLYWYNRPVDGLPAIETGDVLKYLQEKNKPQ